MGRVNNLGSCISLGVAETAVVFSLGAAEIKILFSPGVAETGCSRDSSPSCLLSAGARGMGVQRWYKGSFSIGKIAW